MPILQPLPGEELRDRPAGDRPGTQAPFWQWAVASMLLGRAADTLDVSELQAD